MITTFPATTGVPSVQSQQRRTRWTMLAFFLGLIGVSLLTALFMMLRSGATPAAIAWALLALVVATILWQPRYGVYLIVGLSLVGDGRLTPWYPFNKNFSSGESLLFLSNAVSFSPLELCIVVTFLSWLAHAVAHRNGRLFTGPLFWPAAAFTLFVVGGFFYGLSRGGDLRIALWEMRSILYLPCLLVLASNLIESSAQVSRLFWIFILAQFVDAIGGVIFLATVMNFNIGSYNEIAEHSYSIHINALVILMLTQWLYRGSPAQRVVLPLMMPVLLLAYLANNRRAGFLTLAVGLVFVGIALYFNHRRLFWMLVPSAALVGALYLAVFWNAGGSLGAPARAVQSVIAPVEGSRDDGSNYYRILENTNIAFTIRHTPFTGVGFGNKFLIIAPMADISFFEWWQYITHNSIMWIWMQTGIGGFLAMLMLIGKSLVIGAQAVINATSPRLRAMLLTANVYVIMHFVYAYVDMAWEAQSMVLVGSMLGLLNAATLLTQQSDETEATS